MMVRKHVEFSLGIFLNNEDERLKNIHFLRPDTYVDPFQQKLAAHLIEQDFSFTKLYQKEGKELTVWAMQLANDVQRYINTTKAKHDNI
jgi:hypothetical protein